MPLFKSGRKLYIARFRRVGDRKVYTWEQWHRDGRSAREAFTKALEREFAGGYKLLSVKKATAAEERKIFGGHSLSNPIGLLSAAVVGATAGATSVFVRHKLEETAAGKNPAFPGKPGERFAGCVREMSKRPGVRSPEGLCAAIGRRKHGKAGMKALAGAGRKQAGGNPYQVLEVDGLGRRTRRGRPYAAKAAAITRADQLKRAYPLLGFEVVVSNPAGTGFSIAMVPRKGPRLVLPRVFASKAEAQKRAGKIRRPFGTRTAIVSAANPVPLSAPDTFYYHVTKTGRRYYYFSHRASRWMPTKKGYAENLIAQGKAVAKRFSKGNPYDDAAAASEGFHGRPVKETIEIVTPEHHHEYLAALGELIKLEVLAPDSDRQVIPLKGFKGAWLAENEERNQLFVRGGNQSLPDDQLRRFDVDLRTLHETEVLGPLAAVTYYTVKYHLGEQGGNANFRHVFGEDGGKLPVLVYKVRDGLVEIAGGSYTIPDEGITN